MSTSRGFLSQTEGPPTVPPLSPSPPCSGGGRQLNPVQNSQQLARSYSLSIMPDPKGTVPSGSLWVPLLASEQSPAILLQDALSQLSATPKDALWQEQSPMGPNLPDSHPKLDWPVNGPGQPCSAANLGPGPKAGEGQDSRKALGQRGSTEGAGGMAALQQGERLLAGSEGTAEEAEVREVWEGPGRVASVVARAAASREVVVAASASGAWCPGEGGGERERRQERGLLSGEVVPKAGGLGTLPAWSPGGRVARKAPWEGLTVSSLTQKLRNPLAVLLPETSGLLGAGTCAKSSPTLSSWLVPTGT